jgi:hypothetical protein
MAGIEACDQPLTPEKAFVVRTLLIHAYRRVQLHDPQLPVELLPTPWPGALAYELARQIYLLGMPPPNNTSTPPCAAKTPPPRRRSRLLRPLRRAPYFCDQWEGGRVTQRGNRQVDIQRRPMFGAGPLHISDLLGRAGKPRKIGKAGV